jgi:hypothetical protein
MGMPMRPATREQITEAYKRMATEASYRPRAPSDGLGNITVPVEELDLDAEADSYADRWWAEEDRGEYDVGVCHGSFRPATIFAIEAARLMCSGVGSEAHVMKLLRMAADDIEGTIPPQDD